MTFILVACNLDYIIRVVNATDIFVSNFQLVVSQYPNFTKALLSVYSLYCWLLKQLN